MALHRFPYIESSLAGYFSVNVGHSESGSIAQFRQNLDNLKFRSGIERELRAAFSEPAVSWLELFQEYEVANVSTEEEARQLRERICG